MRLLVDTLIALLLVGILAGIGWHRHQQSVQLRQVEAVQGALRAIEAQTMYHAGLAEAQLSKRGYPMTVEAAWFAHPPANALAGGRSAAWMDQASDAERDRWDPARIAADSSAAAFWYNPYRGIVRARVPRQITDRATVELYNLVNGSSLDADEMAW